MVNDVPIPTNFEKTQLKNATYDIGRISLNEYGIEEQRCDEHWLCKAQERIKELRKNCERHRNEKHCYESKVWGGPNCRLCGSEA